MRVLFVSLFLLFAGCDEGSATRGPEPAPAPAEGGEGAAAVPAAGPSDCVQKCVDSRAMEARSPDDIKRDCEKECSGK